MTNLVGFTTFLKGNETNSYLPRPPLRLLPPLLLRPPPMEPDEREGGDTEGPLDLPPELGRTLVGRDAGRAGRAELEGRLVDDGRTLWPDGRRVVPDGRTLWPAGRRVVPDGRTLCPDGRRVVPLLMPSLLRISREPEGRIDSRVRVPRLTSPADARRPPAARVTIRPFASRARVPFGLRTAERAVRALIRSREAERGALVRLSTMT